MSVYEYPVDRPRPIMDKASARRLMQPPKARVHPKYAGMLAQAEEIQIEEIESPAPCPAKKIKRGKKIAPEVRAAVLARDGGHCTGCGAEGNLHIHHIKHREDGGDDSHDNLISLCEKCHAERHEGEPIFNLMSARLLCKQLLARCRVYNRCIYAENWYL